ncbi:MAG: carbohydrate binding domain-containing protein [Sedimentisphaerales bacterium]|nr:carbohydrate binding domain-containing protein [Sedimentisphaerales bacterium]
MSRTLFSLVCVSLLSLASTSHAVVVGNFEGEFDGWYTDQWTSGEIAFSPVGATLGYVAMQVTAPGDWHNETKVDMKPYRTKLAVKGTTITADITAFEADLPDANALSVEMVINAEGDGQSGPGNTVGWQSIGSVNIVLDGQPHKYTWTISGELADKIAKTDGNIWWFELALASWTNGTATKFYIDNIELNDPAKKIIYVTSVKDMDKNGAQDDLSWVDWLTAAGYDVDARPGYWSDPLDANEIAELEAADLIIASRGMNTGEFDGAETAKWNAVSKPIICTNAWMVRTNRWKWMNSGDARKDADSPILLAWKPDHPVFKDVPLDPDGLVEILDPNVASGHTSFLFDILDPGNGTLLAQSLGTYNTAWVVEWDASVEYYPGSVEVAGGRRLLFMAGTQDDPYTVPDGNIAPVGVFNLNEAGQQMFRNAIEYMLTPPAGSATNLLTNGGFEDGTLTGWNIYGNATGTVVTELAGAAVAEGVKEGTYCLYVEVPAKTTNFWDAGLQPQGIVFEKDKSYTFSVWLKAKSGTLEVNMKPEKAADPWTGYGEKMMTVTEEWQEYSVTTPVFAADTAPAGFTFHIGNAVGGFWVDGMRYYEGDYVEP